MAVSADFLEMVREACRFVPELSSRRMFGGVGVFCGRAMFAIIAADALYLKSDAENREAFEAEGLEPFLVGPDKRAIGYRQAPESVFEDEDEARRWIGLAVDAALRKAARSA